VPLHAHLPVLSDLYLPLASLSRSKVVPLRQLRQLAFLGLPTGKEATDFVQAWQSKGSARLCIRWEQPGNHVWHSPARTLQYDMSCFIERILKFYTFE
jgi:hypothetical protein